VRPLETVIVGGGPVGLATAIALRRRGQAAAVIDRGFVAIDKACGEGLMPASRGPLAELGVDVDSLPGQPFDGVRYIDGGIEAVGRFAGLTGRGVRRLDLHRALADRAEEEGVELRWRSPVRGLERGRFGWRLDLDDGAIECRLLVGADGLASRVRRWAGLETAMPRRRRFGVRRHYRTAPWSTQVEVHWGAGCEAYVTPIAADVVGVAILWSGRRAGFDELLGSFPALEGRLVGEILSRDRGAGPFLRRPRRVALGDSLALVGDAAGYVDALTGEGLALGFRQATALAAAIEAGDLSRWPAEHRGICRTADELTRLTLLLSRYPRLRRRALSVFARQPELFERFLAVQNGARPAVPDGAAALARLGLRLLASRPERRVDESDREQGA